MEIKLNEALKKGIDAHKAGKFEEADRFYTAILKANPNHPDANHNMGVLAVGVGKAELALPFFKAALEGNKNISQFWTSYIDALVRLEKFGIAKTTLEQAKKFDIKQDTLDNLQQKIELAVSLKVGQIDSYELDQNEQKHLMNLNKQGRFKEALEQANNLSIEYPRSIFLANLLGVLNSQLGKFDEAIEAFSKVIEINPNYCIAYYNLGNCFKSKGMLPQAVESYKRALKINPDYTNAYNNLSIILREIEFTAPSKSMQNILLKILEEDKYGDPGQLCKSSISLLRLDPTFININSTSFLEKIDGNFISELSELKLLIKLMSVTQICDLEVEVLLQFLRSKILSYVSTGSKIYEFKELQSALALQCFITEYIYQESTIEKQMLSKLEDQAKDLIANGKQPSPQIILCLGSYRALVEYDWIDEIEINCDIEKVFKMQVLEPRKEKQLKALIPSLSKISDKISLSVKNQYEQNPYPRWLCLGFNGKSQSISDIVRASHLKLEDLSIEKVDSPSILIVGCGTGRHAIDTARTFRNSRVLAVDLSFSSLAYAKRKTDEYKVKNIEYMQGDILELLSLGRRFDIIESVGVLHHMDSPISGWKVLTECLNSNGLMKIGLYSTLARRHIKHIRDETAVSSSNPTVSYIRSFRKKILNSNEPYHKLIKTSPDFYTISSLRDLLFHVQEKRFTIPEIKNCLDELDLKFCGFTSINKFKKFSEMYSSQMSFYDLDKWHEYEKHNPRAFAGMYEFWCQKTA